MLLQALATHLLTQHVTAITATAPSTAAGALLHAPRFSKYLHGVASLLASKIHRVPYWFLPEGAPSKPGEGQLMSPATWEEMASQEDCYKKVQLWK